MVTIGRDVVLILVGAAGIVHQELIGPVKPELLVLYGTMLGIPGVANLIGLARGLNSIQSAPDSQGHIATSPSAPVSPASLPPSS